MFYTIPSFGGKYIIYVSINGDDKNQGTRCAPLASLDMALEKANVMQSSGSQNDIEIRVGNGIFWLKKNLIFKPSKKKNPSQLTIRGAGRGKSIISGGIKLPKFVKDEDTGMWVSHLERGYEQLSSINQLFVNNKRAVMARTPNFDEYIVPIKATEECVDEKEKWFEQTVFLPQSAKGVLEEMNAPQNAYITIFHYWDMSRRRIKVVDCESTNVKINGSSVERWNYFSSNNTTQLYLENDLSFLDVPGEFYFDQEKRLLYYYPSKDEDIKNASAVVPISDILLSFDGCPGNPVANINIKDLTFAHSAYFVPERGEEPQQGVVSKDAAIILDYASNVVFSDCEITHTGAYGAWFRAGCIDCQLVRCYLHDLGAGGVKIGETRTVLAQDTFLTRRIIIDNNIIREGGRTLPPGVGTIILKASDCQITHNEIADFYYTGISLGWVWGFAYSPSKRNIVSNNHIHHIGWGGLSDMGGIYTLGVSDGTSITNNIIHDIYSYGSDGNGIYTDEGSSNILISGNIVYRCKSSGFTQHYGKDNIIQNNIFAENIEAQLGVGASEQNNNSLVFKNNVVYSSRSGQIIGNNWWGEYSKLESNSNVYWSGGEMKMFNHLDHKEWMKKTGKDSLSFVLNPIRGNTKNAEDIIMSLNKVASKYIQFRPICIKDVGVYGRRQWKLLSEMESERKAQFNRIIK